MITGWNTDFMIGVVQSVFSGVVPAMESVNFTAHCDATRHGETVFVGLVGQWL